MDVSQAFEPAPERYPEGPLEPGGNLRERIFLRRDQMGLTNQELAERIAATTDENGVVWDPSGGGGYKIYLDALEQKQERWPDRTLLKLIATVLEVSVDHLYGEYRPKIKTGYRLVATSRPKRETDT